MNLKPIFKALFESLFHSAELYFLRKQNKDLKEQNRLLLTGDPVNLTSHERLVILDALTHPDYVAKVSEPKIKYRIRQAYRRAKEKMAIVEAFHRRKESKGGG